ncbi:hypothetical protein BKA67DRAFT_670000 [Truncatella angustata]|uniref:Uncharacterized protein n=1 Tax=Truncatella angustata TaxID=152316 RepID=A0A9P8RLV8_9PEZI|nr:uncharacterized protein BKA67DRAFT_670000 [Truncatella angustata]KAH6645625.1 hypothetical protein BKA67DRAFT_670000 [Truncatella angustata]
MSEEVDMDLGFTYDVMTSAYNVMVLKDCIRTQAFSIKGTKKLEAYVETVRNYWTTSTGVWKREHQAVDTATISTATQFIYRPLKEELVLLLEKRHRRYANENPLSCYAEQVWGQERYVYQRPSTRVNDWRLFLSNVFSMSI